MYNILVVFNDGSEKIFNNVKQYGYTKGQEYYIEKIDNNNNETTLKSFLRPENIKYFGPVEFWEDIKNEESKLIRCKDCKYLDEDPYIFENGCCTRISIGIIGGMSVNPDDFCSRAVRRF